MHICALSALRCAVTRDELLGGGAAEAQAGDGVRKFQMGGVPDRGGSTLGVGIDA